MSDTQADQSEADSAHPDDARPASITPEERQKALRAQPPPIGHINAARTIVLPKRRRQTLVPGRTIPTSRAAESLSERKPGADRHPNQENSL